MVNDNGERALAYISHISKIDEIAGADNIALATVLGWKVIIKKAEFKEGDKCVFFEIDSKVPSTDKRFEFLASKDYRIRTLKLNKFGVFSQGLAMPISEFSELANLPENTDVTKQLGVIYYMPEDNVRKAANIDPMARYKSMAARHYKMARKPWFKWMMKREWGRKVLFFFFGKKKDKPKSFPNKFAFVHKTDETRIECLPELLGYKNPLIVTEKLDGTSCTYILARKGRNFEFYVCSRNVRMLDEKQECHHDTNIYWNMARKYNIQEHLENYLQENPNLSYVCIQGEGVGFVQDNPLKLKEDDLYVFNFITSDRGRWSSIEGKNLIETWGMKWVPILDSNFFMPDDMEEFKSYATAKSVVNPSVYREGVVLRDPTCDLSFKNVSREYLLKHNG